MTDLSSLPQRTRRLPAATGARGVGQGVQEARQPAAAGPRRGEGGDGARGEGGAVVHGGGGRGAGAERHHSGGEPRRARGQGAEAARDGHRRGVRGAERRRRARGGGICGRRRGRNSSSLLAAWVRDPASGWVNDSVGEGSDRERGEEDGVPERAEEQHRPRVTGFVRGSYWLELLFAAREPTAMVTLRALSSPVPHGRRGTNHRHRSFIGTLLLPVILLRSIERSGRTILPSHLIHLSRGEPHDHDCPRRTSLPQAIRRALQHISPGNTTQKKTVERNKQRSSSNCIPLRCGRNPWHARSMPGAHPRLVQQGVHAPPGNKNESSLCAKTKCRAGSTGWEPAERSEVVKGFLTIGERARLRPSGGRLISR